MEYDIEGSQAFIHHGWPVERISWPAISDSGELEQVVALVAESHDLWQVISIILPAAVARPFRGSLSRTI